MGNIIQVVQNTPAWRQWREKGLGASDAPIVMGKSPWTTRFQLWAYKSALIERPAPNSFQVAAMERGHELEPLARERYETRVGDKFPATSFEHAEYPFLKASLDGYNKDLNINLEIKCPGKLDHATALSGRVPDKYIPQVQMQMLICGADLTHYFSWDGKESEALLTVPFDAEYCRVLLIEMRKFWKLLQTGKPPDLAEEDIKELMGVMKKDLDRLQQSFKALSLIMDIKTKREGL